MARLTVPSPTDPNRVLADPLQDPSDTVSFAQEVEVPSVHSQDSVDVPMPDESERVTPSEELSAMVDESKGVTESTEGGSASTVPLDQLDPPTFPRRSVILHSMENWVSASGREGIEKEPPETPDHGDVPFRHSAPE
tara:strand:- start:132 stop:542 length:411 start_codon:yes stop_codon:yes gene_type:complete